MPREGYVNYHVHKPERQAFHIDAGGVVGTLVSPELATTRVAVLDERAGEATVDFEHDGVRFLQAPTSVADFGAHGMWHATYDAELRMLMTQTLGVTDVIVFDHTLRTDDPCVTRKPARNVHSDYSEAGARQRLVDILGIDTARDWSRGHYAFVNTWRPVGHPINSAPLGFLRAQSVPQEDWLVLDLVYPDRTGQIMGLVGSSRHEWVYRSRMTPEEVVIFNIYDNKGRPSVAHSAIDLVEDESISTIRQSIESRTLVRWASP